MDRADINEMENVTYVPLSYQEFTSKYSGLLVRTEVEGVDVGLYQDPENHTFTLFVVVDGEQLYSDHFPFNFPIAYQSYLRQIKFVRGVFTQGWRKEIFYYKDPHHNNSILSVIYA